MLRTKREGDNAGWLPWFWWGNSNGRLSLDWRQYASLTCLVPAESPLLIKVTISSYEAIRSRQTQCDWLFIVKTNAIFIDVPRPSCRRWSCVPQEWLRGHFLSTLIRRNVFVKRVLSSINLTIGNAGWNAKIEFSRPRLSVTFKDHRVVAADGFELDSDWMIRAHFEVLCRSGLRVSGIHCDLGDREKGKPGSNVAGLVRGPIPIVHDAYARKKIEQHSIQDAEFKV